MRPQDLKNQTHKKRRCSSHLVVPSDTDGSATENTIFVCTLDAGHPDEHVEHGYVHLRNGTTLEFHILWKNLGPRSARTAH